MKARPERTPRTQLGAAEDELPRSATVLLLVDVINPLDFFGAEDLASPALAAADAIADLKRRLADEGVAAVYANDNYGRWQSDFGALRERCRQAGGPAAALLKRLAPGPDDITILKPRHSAFYATPLELILAQMRARRLVIVGYAADSCVQMSAMDAYLRGFRVWVPRDCTAAESPQRLEATLRFLQTTLRADVRPARRG